MGQWRTGAAACWCPPPPDPARQKVLVERVFAYLTEEHCHIDDFLIITFTRAAAAELRTKLAAELAKRVAQDPENSHLRQQMFRVYQADIKTVDGFCAGLLREHIHLLEPVDGRSLTPDFRILDETEAGVLKQRALEDALEAFYQRIEQGDEGCRALAETLGFGRDDRALAALVPELHGKLQSHPYPDKWLEKRCGELGEPAGTAGRQRVRPDDHGGHGAPRQLLGGAAGTRRERYGRLRERV